MAVEVIEQPEKQRVIIHTNSKCGKEAYCIEDTDEYVRKLIEGCSMYKNAVGSKVEGGK